jgi:hypothetical protein
LRVCRFRVSCVGQWFVGYRVIKIKMCTVYKLMVCRVQGSFAWVRVCRVQGSWVRVCRLIV